MLNEFKGLGQEFILVHFLAISKLDKFVLEEGAHVSKYTSFEDKVKLLTVQLVGNARLIIVTTFAVDGTHTCIEVVRKV